MSKWKLKTFKEDNCKDMHCTNCGRYLNYDSRLYDKKMKRIVCTDCGTHNVIFPPRRDVIDNKPVMLFRDAAPGRDPLDCTFTSAE